MMILACTVLSLILKHKFIFVIPGELHGINLQDPDQLYQFVEKDVTVSGSSFYCTICLKKAPTRRDIRNHVESIHFPNMFQYDCQFCDKKLKTKKSKDWHMGSVHKDIHVKGKTSIKM